MTDRHRTARRSRVVMWASVALAVAVLVALLARGWANGAWNVAAGVLVLGCIAACGSAVVAGRRSEREVRAAIARLARLRDGGNEDLK